MMVKAADNALSGISANILKMDAASNNITNANTPNYKGVRVINTENVGGGARGIVARDENPGNQMINVDTGAVEESSNTSLALDMTNLMLGQRGVSANINVVKTADELLGTLFDIKT